jgi:hypothetical protein
MRGDKQSGASADADRVLSPSATEPVVSAHSGNAPLRKKGEVTLAKEASQRVQTWLDHGEASFGQTIPIAAIRTVLAHYGKLTKPKVSRKGRYVKGREYEYELRDHFTQHGLHCRRVMQSGGGVEKDDLVLTTGWGEQYRLEAKRVAKLPAYLINPQCHATIFRMDRGESLVLTTLQRFTELAQ